LCACQDSNLGPRHYQGERWRLGWDPICKTFWDFFL